MKLIGTVLAVPIAHKDQIAGLFFPCFLGSLVFLLQYNSVLAAHDAHDRPCLYAGLIVRCRTTTKIQFGVWECPLALNVAEESRQLILAEMREKLDKE